MTGKGLQPSSVSMTPTSLYPDGAAGFGLNFIELVSYLVERGASR
jgi:D-alanine-D-alanine ligase-like ATP-grasp enzyme